MNLIETAIRAGVPVILWGPPGVGKTSYVQSFAKANGLHCEVVVASLREPSDFAGLPVIGADGTLRMEPPKWARDLSGNGGGLLFLDEISTAPPAVQAALLRVILDKVVGDLKLPEDVMIVAAANPPDQAAGGWDLSAPLANRFCHVDFALDSNAWCQGMISGWPEEDPISIDQRTARSLIASFIRVRPHLLLKIPDAMSDRGRAWPSPRSWTFLADLVGSSTDRPDKMPADELIAFATGCVGSGPAIEFAAWVENLDLPDPEDLLAKPESYVRPNRGDQEFAILVGLVSAVARNPTPARWFAGWAVLARAADLGAPDVAAGVVPALSKLREGRDDLKLPLDLIRRFTPLMKAAGLLQ